MTYIEDLDYDAAGKRLAEALTREIVVLDGAMGTMIQQANLTEEDFRGERFAGWDRKLKGCNDVLVLTCPDVIRDIHTRYLEAGARIIETDSFNGNAASLADYGLADEVAAINVAAAKVAREAADTFMASHPGETCWVAGSVGPSGKSLSMVRELDNDDDVIDWDFLADTFYLQCKSLLEGGVDLFLIETIYDSLNAKAAIWGARRAMESVGRRVPVILSVTLTESGRTLAGQTLEAFVVTVKHCNPLAVGLNCSFGADTMMKYVEALRDYPYAVSVYPNAGLPNAMGEYDETPEKMAAKIEPMLSRGLVNIIGGCCGTTPEHIAAIAVLAAKYPPRKVPEAVEEMELAGLEPLTVSRDRNFVNVGERCNVAGSRKFLRLIKEHNFGEAVEIARQQVEAGAQIVDINMDDAMLDSTAEMASFVSRIGSEPDTAKVPFMIDSSHWLTIMSGLKRVQGRPIVNSISLKEGEESFLEHARYIREMGAAVVVMAFDEHGQADTFDRRVEVCQRAYRLLVEKVGFRGCDIVFDPNVLAVATGIESHRDYALDFIRSVEWIKLNLPGAKVSGGISNLSFSFRGNNYVREAMHALFLYHAIARGLDMGIVNAAAMMPVDEIPADLREAIDDVLLVRRDDATDRLVDIAAAIKEKAADAGKKSSEAATATQLPPVERLEMMLVKGHSDNLIPLLEEVMANLGSAVAVIDGPLMAGMNRVGDLFGEGKLFLPQVVKSARVMKLAVEWLTPYIEEERKGGGESSSAGRMVIATVKGDVHDIGKNIVGVIMSCNGYDIIDLGVMVPGEDIVAKAIESGAGFIGLSGLITPSLEEMCNVARLMESRGMTIPLLIGGATTSALHTAVRIAPCYSGPVIHTRDAAMLPSVAQRFGNPATYHAAVEALRQEQSRLRREYESSTAVIIPYAEAVKSAPRLDYAPEIPAATGVIDLQFKVSEVAGLINWRAFLAAWKLDPSLASVADIHGCDHCRAQWLASMPGEKVNSAAEAMQLIKEARVALQRLERDGILMKARVALLLAGSCDGDIVYEYEGKRHKLSTLRQQKPGEHGECLSLSDYVAPTSDDSPLPDYVGMFAVTSGKVEDVIAAYKKGGDDYKAILYQTLADRLAEAATEHMHRIVHETLWHSAVKGVRPAVGYPSLPDQSFIFELDRVIDYASMGISLTESGAMSPAASTSGLIFTHPKSRYFAIGKIGEDQLADYARRRSMDVTEVKKWLSIGLSVES